MPHRRPTSSTSMAVTTWAAPHNIAGFQPLHNVLRQCIVRTGNRLAMTPQLTQTIDGCKSCNDIMTVASASSEFLVRLNITQGVPLVPDNVIFRQEIYEMGANRFFDGHYRWDPTEDARNGMQGFFSYEACIAYYIHRCLPDRPMTAAAVRRERHVRTLTVALSVALLLVMCLTFERFNGLEGGTKPRNKHAYRYRGVIEMYLAYVFWVLVCNDNPQGEADGFNQQRCNTDFPLFHRYLFSELLQAIVLSSPEFAGAFEIYDVIFGPYAHDRPEEILGHYCQSVATFYYDHFKPMFSRHLSRMDPDRNLEHGPAADVALFARQVLVYNMLASPASLNTMMHFLESATEGDIDTFIDCVGVGSVLAMWGRLLEMVPASTGRLVQDFTRELVLREYSHIMGALRASPDHPKVTQETAETVYLLCNSLYPPAEPENEGELELLREAPKCSRHNAVLRLGMVGAFVKEEGAA